MGPDSILHRAFSEVFSDPLALTFDDIEHSTRAPHYRTFGASAAHHPLRSHGVSFEEATEVFGDPLALTFDDIEHSTGEPRYLTFGVSAASRSVVVAHTQPRHPFSGP